MRVYPEKINLYVFLEKEISYPVDYKNYSFLKLHHSLTRHRALLDLITRPTLNGMAPHVHRENGSEREKHFGTEYASETIQNYKNHTGHIDTLSTNLRQNQRL